MAIPTIVTVPAIAQMTSRPVRDGSRPVRAGSGPVSELSTNVRSGSGPVSGDGGSLRHSSHNRLGGNTVRGSAVTDVRSGSVSDASVGSVHTRVRPQIIVPPIEPDYLPYDEGEVAMDPWSPVWDLHPLAERIRGIQPLSRDAELAAEDEPELPDDGATAFADEADDPNPDTEEAESDGSEADEREIAEPEVDEPEVSEPEIDEPEPPALDEDRVDEERAAEDASEGVGELADEEPSAADVADH